MTKTSVSLELKSIERLAGKVKSMVALLERSRVEQARTAEDNRRLVSEVDALKARLSEAEGADAEMTMLRSSATRSGLGCPRCWSNSKRSVYKGQGG